jgi:cysteine desulfurase / selenocysteine lyase
MNVEEIRKDFPILNKKVKGKPLIYLDSTATSQKPNQVISSISDYYEKYNSNVHRGIHTLSEQATEEYEKSRKKIADFINAKEKEIIFTKNTSESINLLSNTLKLEKGDEVVSTVMEHHSNIVPWQMLREKGVIVKFADINDNGELKNIEELITDKTKLVTFTHSSNVLGTINDVNKINKIAHDKGALTLLDAAQSIPHMPVSVNALDVDFAVFSGHKMLGPTGIGCLYGKKNLLETLPPFMGGGDMIKEVTLEETIYNDVPYKFEAGTPDIAGAIGLGAAVDYLTKIGMDNIREHEKKITKLALESLDMDGVTIYGKAKERGGVVSFNVEDAHSHDVASILDEDGIAVRSGHHCAQPLMKRLGIVSAARASFYIYTTENEIEKLVESIKNVKKVFRK